MHEFEMKSGAILRYNLATFADADNLFKTVMDEAKHVMIHPDADALMMVKQLMCQALSSKAVDRAIRKCAEKALYNNQKIIDATFEDEKAREDYIEVMYKIAEVNLRPFTKSLSALFSRLLDLIPSGQA